MSLLFLLDIGTSIAGLLTGQPGASLVHTAVTSLDALPSVLALLCALTGRRAATWLLTLLATRTLAKPLDPA